MSGFKPSDFWYAVNNTEVVVMPPRRLETFGATVVDYHLVTEPMDSVNRSRVREGRIHAFRPQIVTPTAFMESILEGFQHEAAEAYANWLREHESDLLILRYGFRIRKEGIRDELVSDPVEAVVERVRADLARRENPLAALVRGVDEPWEVCLIKLMVEMVQRSAPGHMQALRADPTGSHHGIEEAFRKAARDPAAVPALAAQLKAAGVFKDYEDRFFAVVRSHRGG